jgi:hypothetical protein
MTERFPISATGSKGLNADVSAHELAPENFSDGNNFKINFDHVSSFSGTTLLTTPVDNSGAGYIDAVKTGDNLYYVTLGFDMAQVYDGANWNDITSTDLAANPLDPADALTYNSCRLGRIPIYNNFAHYPEYWSPQSTTQILQPLEFSPGVTWKARGIKAKIIRAHKDFLFAIGIQDGATEYPLAYRWSHPADANGLPYTWDESDPAALAGLSAIGGSGGNLVDGLTLRDSFVIYSESAINILDYTGDEFVWRRSELSKSFGLAAANCVVEVMGKHYFLSDSDVLMTDGNSISSILSGRVRSKFAADLSSQYFTRSFLVADTGEKEIWVCYPSQDSTYPNTALIYNWETQSVAFRDIAPSMTSMAYSNVLRQSYTWANADYTWNTDKRWNLDPASPFAKTLVGITPTTSSVYTLEDDKSVDSNSSIERLGLILGSQIDSTTIVAIYPKIACQGQVRIQLGSMDEAGGTIRWKPYDTYTPLTQRKVERRTTGKLHCFRIESVGSEKFDYSGMDIEYELDGLR